MKKDYISITECEICKKIPQKQDVEDTYDRELIPESNQLQFIHSLLRKCPNCGTYYYYHHYYDPGEALEFPRSNDNLCRQTPTYTIYNFKRDLKKDPDNEEMQNELKILEGRLEGIINDLEIVVSRKRIGLIWHIKKYIVETLSDYYIENGDWDKLTEMLLTHQDPVIKIETASDIIDILTIKYHIFPMRFFTEEQKESLKEHYINDGNIPKVNKVLVEGMTEKGTAEFFNTVTGYSKGLIAGRAGVAIGHAIYYDIDIKSSIIGLLNYAVFNEEKRVRDYAAAKLVQYLEKNVDHAQIVKEHLGEYENEKKTEQFNEVYDKCKELLNLK